MTSYAPPFPTDGCRSEWHAREGGCYICCNSCNYDNHRCHFCGDDLRHDGKTFDGKENPCYQPDHGPGEPCTLNQPCGPKFCVVEGLS
jgi:hypothetical protein